MPETHHLLNKENVKRLKRGAVLINTARGDVIDPQALIYALDEGIISAAGLDVLEGEHEIKDEAELTLDGNTKLEKIKLLLADHILMDYKNVIITPHIAFNTAEARQEITTQTLANISQFEAGTPQNVIKA
jgi:D-lactate dehydrogenase